MLFLLRDTYVQRQGCDPLSIDEIFSLLHGSQVVFVLQYRYNMGEVPYHVYIHITIDEGNGYNNQAKINDR